MWFGNTVTSEFKHARELLDCAQDVELSIVREIALAGLKVTGFQWNPDQGGGLLFNFPYQMFKIAINDWQSGNELVDTDMIIGFEDAGVAGQQIMQYKISRLLRAYTNHLGSKRSSSGTEEYPVDIL